MGFIGLLSRPWNLQTEDALREFLSERGNQFEGTKRRAPESWTPDTWAKVYGFNRNAEGGWAGRKDGLFAGKFDEEVDPKEGLYPLNCRNPRERRMLEFMLPILNPKKPKRLTLTMANTLFGALSGVRPVKWGLLIQELVNRSIPSIGKKPSYLSPFILHLYQHYGCTTREEDDAITIANEEIHFQVQPVPPDTSTESDEELPEAQPSPPGSPPPAT